MRINILSAMAVQKLKPKEKSFRVADSGNLYFHEVSMRLPLPVGMK
ncbi:hypothetical protein NF212_11535 [Parasalinivibrio latis]